MGGNGVEGNKEGDRIEISNICHLFERRNRKEGNYFCGALSPLCWWCPKSCEYSPIINIKRGVFMELILGKKGFQLIENPVKVHIPHLSPLLPCNYRMTLVHPPATIMWPSNLSLATHLVIFLLLSCFHFPLFFKFNFLL